MTAPANFKSVGKALGYVTDGLRVLVLRDVGGSLAGLGQVPGGTMEAGETPEEAVLREVFEETGLTGLSIIAKLGILEMECPVHPGEWQIRHYFHLTCDLSSACPDTPPRSGWAWVEQTPSGGGGPVPVMLEWEAMDGTDLGLWASYGHFLPVLYEQLTVTSGTTPPRSGPRGER